MRAQIEKKIRELTVDHDYELYEDEYPDGETIADKSCAYGVKTTLDLLWPVIKQAENLWDNRLGHREDNPVWHSPQDIWKSLGKEVSNLRKKLGEGK